MLDPFLSHELAVGRDHRGQRVVLVRVERDIFHRRRLLSRLNTAEYLPRTRSPRRVGGAALTSHQRDSTTMRVGSSSSLRASLWLPDIEKGLYMFGCGGPLDSPSRWTLSDCGACLIRQGRVSSDVVAKA